MVGVRCCGVFNVARLLATDVKGETVMPGWLLDPGCAQLSVHCRTNLGALGADPAGELEVKGLDRQPTMTAVVVTPPRDGAEVGVPEEPDQ